MQIALSWSSYWAVVKKPRPIVTSHQQHPRSEIKECLSPLCHSLPEFIIWKLVIFTHLLNSINLPADSQEKAYTRPLISH